MTTPKRVQQHRTKGWRKPDGAISVARPHTWGNPFEVGKTPGVRTTADAAVELYRIWLPGSPLLADIGELTGHDLMCFCPLDRHAMRMCCWSWPTRDTATADLNSALINLAARGRRRSGRLTVSPV